MNAYLAIFQVSCFALLLICIARAVCEDCLSKAVVNIVMMFFVVAACWGVTLVALALFPSIREDGPGGTIIWNDPERKEQLEREVRQRRWANN